MAIRRWLLRNLGLKVLSLGIAVAVWFALSGERRERISERTYRIPLSVVNIPPRSLIASPLPASVDVRLRGPFTALRQLEPEKLEAVIDLYNAPLGSRVYRLTPEDVNVPPDVEVISLSPPEVPFTLDAVEEKILPVLPALSGEPAEGSRVLDVEAEPRVARVAGPATVLARMESVSTDPVSVAGRAATFSTPATVLASAPGVRVRQGQIVNVTVWIGPAPTPSPPPAGHRGKSR